jgi:hypothetical protein
MSVTPESSATTASITFEETPGVRLVRHLVARLPLRLQRALAKGWLGWQRTLSRWWWARDIVAPAAFLVIGRVVAALFQSRHPQALSDNIGVEIVYDIAILLASVSFIRWTVTWGVPQMMADVRKIAHATREPSREFLREVASENVRGTRQIVEGLTHGSFTVENPEELQKWFTRFFAKGGNEYVGVDHNRPAKFIRQYDWYLAAHKASLELRGNPTGDRRIIATPRQQITDDFRFPSTSRAYQRFIRWHADAKVDLRWLELQQAKTLQSNVQVPTVDVALWEKFAVAFSSDENSDAITFDMYFPGEPPRDDVSYESLRSYVMKVVGASKELGTVAPRLALVSPELAAAWESYVDPSVRTEGPYGDFLLHALRGKHFVFDAAAGIACDSVFLIKNGFQVVSNEVDERLSTYAISYADTAAVLLSLETLFWETLPQSLAGGFKFEAILCLGNSVCLVDDDDGRVQCLRALHETLRDEDSVLLVDERNYEMLLRDADAINVDPIQAFAPTVHGDLMYCGRHVRGYPVHVEAEQQRVKWRFFDNDPEVQSVEQLDEARIPGDDLLLHAFKHGELYGLLTRAGFCNIRTFADFVDVTPRDGGVASASDIGNANFITYIAARGPRREAG